MFAAITVQPLGPHHCRMRSGSVRAANMAVRGAANVREMLTGSVLGCIGAPPGCSGGHSAARTFGPTSIRHRPRQWPKKFSGRDGRRIFGDRVGHEAVEMHADMAGLRHRAGPCNGLVEGDAGILRAAELHEEPALHAKVVEIA